MHIAEWRKIDFREQEVCFSSPSLVVPNLLKTEGWEIEPSSILSTNLNLLKTEVRGVGALMRSTTETRGVGLGLLSSFTSSTIICYTSSFFPFLLVEIRMGLVGMNPTSVFGGLTLYPCCLNFYWWVSLRPWTFLPVSSGLNSPNDEGLSKS